MEDEYREIVREFYKIYRPLQKKYNLRSHMHFDIYDDGLIEIWEYEGETKKKCISIAREEKDIDCYKRAIDDLKHYQKDREEREHEKVQIWQTDGLGADKETLEGVLNTFKSEGVQDMKSRQALTNYIWRLSDICIRNMSEIDEETTIQMLVDCFGAAIAFHRYASVTECISIGKQEN